jgi:hypothetical protein
MDVQTIFYFFGIFFFVSWFLFLASVVIFIMLAVRWMQKMQTEFHDKVDMVHSSLMDKFNQPATTVLSSLLPLLPTIVAMIKEAKRRKE